MKQEFYEKLSKIVRKEQILEEEPMKKHTTFRIGGPAEYLILPQTTEEIADVIKLCRQEEIPWYIVGNGSNLLVADEGVRGVVIQLLRNFNQIQVEGCQIRMQAGAQNAAVAKRALDASLTGFEFAAGIPGTIGGAVVMNAGAYGGEMKDILKEVTVLDPNGMIRTIPAEELELGYRTSIIARKGYVVLEAVIVLKTGTPKEIKAAMDELKEKRVTKQPLEYPSAGSTFKRPEGYFAGKLIMDAGLRGFSVGGAQISEKHCGFVINKGNATAKDVTELMDETKKIVMEKFGVALEPEVKRLGQF
ncbi:UDP-N-acetylenolpyruvoylglucosamine reductase [uncultured Clostridium sp.]|uniref:UDP-N-acetylenolpyruvoylglucosamine reductase n=1 Tax=Muricoprocola aceti TaxID=2981772 RepID=A0ABT2SL44_9FIRM|nr:UDP-N-acetylmuramate dehydrogenase [Muricoprocola aceti]MCU6724803.1 UDP-N-acetylmuramate dehydrogenase [Muricoprocola aceti]SCH27644.1 UDP-N-acetylenolpyruvoylglucosamine reductase [uncultured Clostridium sp.]